MRIQKTLCDCCGKEMPDGKLGFPGVEIFVEHEETESVELKELDICYDCAKVLMNAYYAECEKHGHAGFRYRKRF